MDVFLWLVFDSPFLHLNFTSNVSIAFIYKSFISGPVQLDNKSSKFVSDPSFEWLLMHYKLLYTTKSFSLLIKLLNLFFKLFSLLLPSIAFEISAHLLP